MESAHRSFRPPEIQVGDSLALLLATRSSLSESLENYRKEGFLLLERLQNSRGSVSPGRNTLAPVLEEAKISIEVSKRIDKATESSMAVSKLDEVSQNLRRVILREPFWDLDGYLAAMIQLEDALSYHRDESASAVRSIQEAVTFLEGASTHPGRTEKLKRIVTDLQAEQAGGIFDGDLLRVARNKLENEFKRLLSEYGLPVSLPPKMGPESEDAPFSSSELEHLFSFSADVLQKLQSIAERLAGTDQYKRCLDAYKDSRSVQCRKSLEALNVKYLENWTPELVDKEPWVDLQIMIQQWTQHVEVAVKVLYAGERRLARQVFKDMGHSVWVDCLNYIAQPGMFAFLLFGESVSKSSRSPEKLCKLLEMMEGLEKSEHSVIQVFDGQACRGIRSRYRELLKQVSDGAFQAFGDMRRWVEEQKEPPIHDGSVMKLCSFVVNYLHYLIREFQGPMNKALKSQQSRWGGDGPQPKDLAQGILLPLQALERQVETRSEELIDPALRHLFLMNNLQYIYTRVEKSRLKDLVDNSWVFGIGRKVDKYTFKFRSAICRKMLTHLNQEGLTGSSTGKSAARSLVRQRLKAFSSALDDTMRTQGNWVIPNESVRDAIRMYITDNVVSAYRSYLESFGPLLEGQFSPSTKYVKYTPDMVEQLLGGLYSSRRQQHCSSEGS